VGFPQAGQQQLFSLLTGIPLEAFQHKPLEAQLGICPVKDPRVTKLAELYKPEKTTYARVEYLLLPDFNLKGPAKATIFTQLKNADELCFVCRADTAEASSTAFFSELVISDLMFVEKRLENIAKNQKKKFVAQREKEQALLKVYKEQLEQEKPLRELAFDSDDPTLIQSGQFLTMKPLILVINVVDEEKVEDIKLSVPAIQVNVGLEQEISQLDEADQAPFLREMGIGESALSKMSHQAFLSLGLISFFTVGEDEVRAWPVRRGSTAVQAGAVIHSDIEKGFIRAEMFSYIDLVQFGSEAKLKEEGKFHLKGKDYIVQDGDILSFRFNV